MMNTFMILVCLAFALISFVQGESPPVKCPRCPPQLISPICASDGRLYMHKCDMDVARCRTGQDITEIPWNECKPKTCNVPCTSEFTQVCGEDGKIHGGNKCTFLWQSCGKPTPLKEAPMSTCQSEK